MPEVQLFEEEEWNEVMEDIKKTAEKQLREDPFYNPDLRKQKTKKEKKATKKFEGYNWTTHKKKIAGLKRKIKEYRAKSELTEKEKLILSRMKSLLAWHTWALEKHEQGWSDKRIHQETLRRKQSKK